MAAADWSHLAFIFWLEGLKGKTLVDRLVFICAFGSQKASGVKFSFFFICNQMGRVDACIYKQECMQWR